MVGVTIKSHRDLQVWQKAMDLVVLCYDLSIAIGSLTELDTLLLIAKRLDYADSERLRGALDLAAEVGRMLSGLTKSLKQAP